MARQGRHDQDHRLTLQDLQGLDVARVALKASEFTKGLVDLHALLDGHIGAQHLNALDAKLRLLVILTQTVDQVVGGRDPVCESRLGKWREGVVVELGRGLRELGKWLKYGTLSFVDLIQHALKP